MSTQPGAPVLRSGPLPGLASVQRSITQAIEGIRSRGATVIESIGSILEGAGTTIEQAIASIPDLDLGPESLGGPGNARSPSVGELLGLIPAVRKVAEEGIETEITLGPSVFLALAGVAALVLLRR